MFPLLETRLDKSYAFNRNLLKQGKLYEDHHISQERKNELILLVFNGNLLKLAKQKLTKEKVLE